MQLDPHPHHAADKYTNGRNHVVPVLLVNDGELRSHIEPREALAIHDTCRLQFPGYQDIAVVVE